MKKLLVAVLAAVVLLAVSPWWLGSVATRRLDRAFQSLPAQAPYLKIVGNKWTDGWFRSEQVITFEFVLPGSSPKTPVVDRGVPLPAAGPLQVPVAQEIPNAAPFGLPQSVRFTLHNVVLHGPILGSAGIGLARVESQLAMSDDVRRKLMDVVGTDEPVRVVTRLGFFGGGTTTVSGEGHKVMLGKLDPSLAGASVAWDDFRLTMSMSGGGKTYDVSGRQPRLEVSNAKSVSHVLASGITVQGSGKRVTQDLYDGGVTFGIGKLSIAEAGQDVEVDALEYGADSARKGDFLDSGVRMGSAEIHNRMLESGGIQLKEVHFDMSLRHLHLETLQKLVSSLRQTDAKIFAGSTDPRAALMTAFKVQGLELIKHDPELTFDRIGIVTPQGEAMLKGSIRLQRVNDADLSAGPLVLLNKTVADCTIEIAQALVDRIPNGATVTGAGVDSGLLKRDGARLVSHIEYRAGTLTINGKAPKLPQGLHLPGMPPVASPPGP